MKISQILCLACDSALEDWSQENKYLQARPESKLAHERSLRAWDRMQNLRDALFDVETLERGLKEGKYDKKHFNTEVIERLERIEWRH